MTCDDPIPPVSQGNCVALSVEQTAARLGVSRALLFREISRGQFPSVRVGGRRLVPLAALERFLEAGATHQAAETGTASDGETGDRH